MLGLKLPPLAKKPAILSYFINSLLKIPHTGDTVFLDRCGKYHHGQDLKKKISSINSFEPIVLLQMFGT